MNTDERRESLVLLKKRLQGSDPHVLAGLANVGREVRELAEAVRNTPPPSVTVEAPAIDWTGMPQPEAPTVNVPAPIVNVEAPTVEVKTDLAPLHRLLKGFLDVPAKAADATVQAIGKLASILRSIEEKLTEPDEVIFGKDQIVERYGKRTVITTFVRSGKTLKKITRTEA